MKFSRLIALIVSIMLAAVGVASVSFAATGGSHHAHPLTPVHQDADAAHGQAMMDCPAHQDGHKMQDAQCAVACASLAPALDWHGIAMAMPVLPAEDYLTAAVHPLASRTPHIPTPPPDLS